MTPIMLFSIGVSASLVSTGFSVWFILRKLRGIETQVQESAECLHQRTLRTYTALLEAVKSTEDAVAAHVTEEAQKTRLTATTYMNEHSDELKATTEALKAHAKEVVEVAAQRVSHAVTSRVVCVDCKRIVVKFEKIADGIYQCLDCKARG